MTDLRIRVSAEDSVGKTVEQYREFLEERIDPDSGLFQNLLPNGTLSRKKHSQIKDNIPMDKRKSLP